MTGATWGCTDTGDDWTYIYVPGPHQIMKAAKIIVDPILKTPMVKTKMGAALMVIILVAIGKKELLPSMVE